MHRAAGVDASRDAAAAADDDDYDLDGDFDDDYEDDDEFEDGEFLGGYMDPLPGDLMDFPFDPEDLLDDHLGDFGANPMFVLPPPDLDFDGPLEFLDDGAYLGSLEPPADFGSDLMDSDVEDGWFSDAVTQEVELEQEGMGEGQEGQYGPSHRMQLGTVGFGNHTTEQQQQQQHQQHQQQQQQQQWQEQQQ
jgi:hypothetical protein